MVGGFGRSLDAAYGEGWSSAASVIFRRVLFVDPPTKPTVHALRQRRHVLKMQPQKRALACRGACGWCCHQPLRGAIDAQPHGAAAASHRHIPRAIVTAAAVARRQHQFLQQGRAGKEQRAMLFLALSPIAATAITLVACARCGCGEQHGRRRIETGVRQQRRGGE